MSNISDKLIQLSNIKSDIKTAINNKGQSVGDDFSTYANAIDNITTGDGPVYQNPDFYEARTNGGTNYKYLFAYCNTPSLDLSNWDTSKATDMSYMFDHCSSSISSIENWDTSNVTNTSYMFNSFTNNNTYLDLSVLDFSNASNVDEMFQFSNTDYLDVRNINLSGATSYDHLFSNCGGTELDLSAWDISNVTNLYQTFSSSNHKKIDLTGWNTSKVTDMGYLFRYLSSLETLIIPDWDMTNTTNTTDMFYNTSKLKYIDASRCNATTMTKLASLIPTRTQAAYGEIITPADLAQETIDALTAKYWKPIGPKLDLISTELALELDKINPGETIKLSIYNNDPWYGDDRPEAIEFISSDESVATINGKEITGVANGIVEITAVRREDGVTISTAPVTLTVNEDDNNPNLIKFRTNGSEGTSNMLTVNGSGIKASQCTKDATGIYSYDPGKQITSIKFCGGYSSGYINEIVKFNFNAANITDMTEMFKYYKGTTLDLSDWDTSNVTKMNSMFAKSSTLVSIIGELDLSNLSEGLFAYVSTLNPFDDCNNLEILYLKNIYKDCTMTNEDKWRINLGETKVKDECLLYIINELPDLINDKGLTTTSNIRLTLPPTNTLTQEQVQVAINKGWRVLNTTY